MRHLVIMLFLLQSFNLQAQVNIRATRQGWASGACCQNGINYEIIITGPVDSIQKMEPQRLQIDAYHFEFPSENPIMSIDSSSIATIRYSFGIILNPYLENDNYQLESDSPDNIENFVVIRYRRKELKILINEITEIPPIPYP